MIQAVAVINEKNDRTFTRIYRLAAMFGVPRILAVNCPVVLRGNLFSAEGRVEIERHTLDSFEWYDARLTPYYVYCDAQSGNDRDDRVTAEPGDDIVLMCDCRRKPPMSYLRGRVIQRFHVPTLRKAPELCTDQAVAIALHGLYLNL